MSPVYKTAPAGSRLNPEQVADVMAQACPAKDYRDRKVLVIVPDGTRTAPVGLLFQTLYRQIGETSKAFDILIALGTHQPMSEAAICRRLEISVSERTGTYRRIRFFNHAWNNPSALTRVGVIPAGEISRLSNGLFAMDVPVDVNRMVFDYDQIIIIGPVFPHEVVGFTGGNKYLFPGIAGPSIIHFTHWLGALISSFEVIGTIDTPVRAVIDRAAALLDTPVSLLALVVSHDGVAGLFCGEAREAWRRAAALSARRHIVW